MTKQGTGPVARPWATMQSSELGGAPTSTRRSARGTPAPAPALLPTYTCSM